MLLSLGPHPIPHHRSGRSAPAADDGGCGALALLQGLEPVVEVLAADVGQSSKALEQELSETSSRLPASLVVVTTA